MLGNDGRISLMDFDVARMLEEQSMTVTGTCIGTPRYMSPEQVKGEHAKIDIDFDDRLTKTRSTQRLSCPKRSTIGAFFLEELEPEWFDYIVFHLTTLGCHFCRTNLKNLEREKTTDQEQIL